MGVLGERMLLTNVNAKVSTIKLSARDKKIQQIDDVEDDEDGTKYEDDTKVLFICCKNCVESILVLNIWLCCWSRGELNAWKKNCIGGDSGRGFSCVVTHKGITSVFASVCPTTSSLLAYLSMQDMCSWKQLFCEAWS